MKKKSMTRIIATGISIALTFQALHPIGVSAEQDDVSSSSQEVLEAVSMTDDAIENSSLIIGSYIIHINGLTDEVYEMATESANEYNQHNQYYKSELAGGKWFDVTSAKSLEDIISSGTPVDKSVIESLQFTHQVSSTGEVTDLRLGYTVSALDITSPYCLWDLEELEPIENQLKLLQEKKGKTESDKATIYMLQQFYGKSIRNSTTDRYDTVISGLEKYKNGLSGRDKPGTWVEEVQKVMKHTDAMRRVEAFQILTENIDELLNQVSGQSDSTIEYDDDGSMEEVEEYYVNSDVVDAIGQATEKVEESILSYSSQILSEGSTASSQARYKYTQDLMDSVKTTTTYYAYNNLPWYFRWYSLWIRVRATTTVSYDESQADTVTQKLVDSANISSGTIVDVNSERSTAEEMASDAIAAYKEKLAAGISEDYQQAVSENASQSVLTKYLTDQKTDTNAARLEYQSLLSAYFERMSNTSKQQTIEKLLDDIPGLEALVPDDAVKNYQLETVEDHRDWLRQELASAMADSADTSEMDALQEELSDLEMQRQAALDNNDLAEEKKLAADMEAKQTDIDNLTKKLLDTISSSSSTEAQKARALAGLGDNNAAAAITSLASDIASAIRNSSSQDTNTATDSQQGSGSSTDTMGGSEGTGTGDGSADGQGQTGDSTGVSGTDTDIGTGDSEGSSQGTTGDGSSTDTSGSGTSDTDAQQGGGIGSSATSQEQSGTGQDTDSSAAVDTSRITSQEDLDLLNKMAAFSELSSLDADAASAGLSQIEAALENASSMDSTLAASLRQTAGTTRRKIDSAISKDGSNLTSAELTQLIEDVLGCSIDEASSLQLASAVLALSRFGYDYHNINAQNLAVSYAGDMYQNKDSYVYSKLSGESQEYVSLKSIGAVLGYRYVFDDTHYSVTLSRGTTYNTFVKGEATYTKTGEKTDTLSTAPKYQASLYLISDDAYSIYRVSAGYVRQCDYAIVVTAQVSSLTDTLYNEMVDQLR